jgi:plasmid stability protein
MAEILVRKLDVGIVERLKSRAKSGGRSLQAEVREILKSASEQLTPEEARLESAKWHRKLAGRITGDSADLIRRDRDR